MVLKAYFDLMSQPSRAIVLFLRMNAIPCEELPVALRKGEHLSEKYAEINPFKRVPAINHDGFKLTESVAILKYLCRTFTVPDHWYPKTDVKKQAKIDEYMAWQHLNLRASGSMYFQTKVIKPLTSGIPYDAKRLEGYGRRLDENLTQIEKIWLKDHSFIASKELSIADLLAVTELEQPGMAGYNVRRNHPGINSYMDLVKNQLEPHYSQVHEIVYKMGKKFEALSQAKI